MMRAPPDTTASHFTVQHSSSSSSSALHMSSSPPHPPHPSPPFISPSHSSPRLPLLFTHDQPFLKKPAADIGYARHAQQSDNMNLSLQWSKEGQLIQWEKQKPFAVRDRREREARLARGEKEEERPHFDLWSQFPPVFNPISAAPSSYNSQHRNPLLPPPSSAPPAPPSSSSLKLQARQLLAQASAYDPYDSIDLPFHTTSPSHYTSIYQSSSPQLNAPKVSLVAHPTSAYHRPSKGSNHRWTADVIHFRHGERRSSEVSEGRVVDIHEVRDLLFDAPLYSSFSIDGIYREPKRKSGKKVKKWTKISTPRMRKREEEKEEESEREDERGEGKNGRAMEREEVEEGIVKVEVRSSGVYVPRSVSAKFIPSSQYVASKSKLQS